MSGSSSADIEEETEPRERLTEGGLSYPELSGARTEGIRTGETTRTQLRMKLQSLNLQRAEVRWRRGRGLKTTGHQRLVPDGTEKRSANEAPRAARGLRATMGTVVYAGATMCENKKVINQDEVQSCT